MKNADVILIGGGVIGLMTAREFLNGGAAVILLEKNVCGQESSWAGGGILSPLYPWRQSQAITDLVLPSLKCYPQIATELFENTGIDPEWTQNGLLITQNPDIELAQTWCKNSQVKLDIPDNSFFQNLNSHSQQSIFLPEIAQIRNPRLLQALKQDVLNKGLHLVENCEITSFSLQHQKIQYIESTQDKFSATEVVMTTGAWTHSIFQKLLIDVTGTPRIYPAKGEMLLFDTKPNTLPHIVLEGEHYLIPRRDGKILVGSTVEYDVFHKDLTLEAKKKLLQFATSVCPLLKQSSIIKHWAGLRPATDNGVPYIGRHPDVANLSLNAGHFRNGLNMAPASAQLLVDLLLNRLPVVNPKPYQFLKHLS